jgi:integrase
LKNIQSVFSGPAMNAYRSLNLPPNIMEFARALPLPARRQEEPEHLKDEFVMQLVEGSDALLKRDPGTWAAFQLMLWAGLRNNEAAHARKNWLQRTLNGYSLSLKATGDFIPKGNSREVIIPTEVAKQLLQLPQPPRAAGLPPDDHIVPAKTETDRKEACYYRINEWLREQGVGKEVGKVAYRLRKYFLKKVAVQQHPLMAQAAAGHSSFETTESHYIGKAKMTEPIRLPADVSKSLSFRVDEKPAASEVPVGKLLSLVDAAQLLEVNASDLAARSETAATVTCDGYLLAVRREGVT